MRTVPEFRKKKFVFVNEYITAMRFKHPAGNDICGQYDEHDPDPLAPELPYLKQRRLGRGVSITHDYWGCFNEKALDEIAAYADYVCVDSRVLTPDHFDLFVKKMRQYPNKFYHRALIEPDTRTDWASHPEFFRSHKEAIEWWRQYVLNDQKQWSNNGETLKKTRSNLLPGGNLADYIKLGMPCREYTFTVCAGEVWSIQYYFDWGFDAVTLERNLLCGNVNVGVAFLRGLAWQYGDKIWGLDPTCWVDFHWPDFMPTAFDEQERQLGGVSPDLYFREWIAARMNGADFLHQIFSETGFFNMPFKPQEKRVLSPVGRKAVEFQALLEGPLQDVGRAVAPVAVMLDHYHGWCESRWDREFALSQKVPWQLSDKSIANFFAYVFPGYELGARSGMKYYQKELPWFGLKEQREAIDSGRADRRLMEKGILTETRFGDIIDVVTDRISAERLAAYPLVILLGGITLTEQLVQMLEVYARNGGTVVLNIRHYPDKSFYAFGGIEVDGVYGRYEGHAICEVCGATLDDYAYEYSLVRLNADVLPLIRSEDDAVKHPILAAERQVGKGRVITSFIYHYTVLKGEQLAGSVRHLLDHVIEPLIPFEVQGKPAQMIINRSESDSERHYVTLLNQHEESWRGAIRRKAGPIREARDAITGETMSLGANWTVDVAVPPYGARIVKVC